MGFITQYSCKCAFSCTRTTNYDCFLVGSIIIIRQLKGKSLSLAKFVVLSLRKTGQKPNFCLPLSNTQFPVVISIPFLAHFAVSSVLSKELYPGYSILLKSGMKWVFLLCRILLKRPQIHNLPGKINSSGWLIIESLRHKA